jgi:hypothetical protein
LIHVTQVILAGWNNFRAMVSGYEIRGVDEPALEAERKSWRRSVIREGGSGHERRT